MRRLIAAAVERSLLMLQADMFDVNDWVKVTIDEDDPNVLSWVKVPFQP